LAEYFVQISLLSKKARNNSPQKQAYFLKLKQKFRYWIHSQIGSFGARKLWFEKGYNEAAVSTNNPPAIKTKRTGPNGRSRRSDDRTC